MVLGVGIDDKDLISIAGIPDDPDVINLDAVKQQETPPTLSHRVFLPNLLMVLCITL